MNGAQPPDILYASQLYSLSILRPLQNAIIARGEREAWFFDPGIDAAPWLASDERLLLTVSEVKAYNPDAVFVPGNVVPDFFPGLKAQVFQGLAKDFVGKKWHYRIRGFFDLYCTRAAEETRIFSEMAQTYGHFEVAETGWPKLAPLFRGRVRDLRPELGTAMINWEGSYGWETRKNPSIKRFGASEVFISETPVIVFFGAVCFIGNENFKKRIKSGFYSPLLP